jgi:predicted transcriptional regulator of viral defense system
MARTKTAKVLEIARKAGVLRPRDLDAHRIPREFLRRLHARGLLDRVDRGLYVPTNANVTEHHSLVQAQKRVPRGVICLLSALRFHGLTTQAPFQVWMAIGERDRKPKVVYPPLNVVRFSGAALTAGVEHHKIEGTKIRIYNPAKTVADCFKYRNKIGLDVAMEALRECWRARRCTMDDLWRYAKVCRVQNVMRPYLESLTQ